MTDTIPLMFQNSLTLEKLNLTGNAVEGEGALYFARMLLDNEYIQELVSTLPYFASKKCTIMLLDIHAYFFQ